MNGIGESYAYTFSGKLAFRISNADRRFIEVTLTEKGKALKDPILETVEEVNRDVLAIMSEKEQEELKDSLRALAGIAK